MLGPRQPSRARPRAVPATACSNRLRDYLPKEMLPEENFGLDSQAVTVKNWSQEATFAFPSPEWSLLSKTSSQTCWLALGYLGAAWCHLT